jgi:hypothetical protein
VDTWEELAEARRSGPSVLPTTLPGPFREVVERCLDEDPLRRPGADEIRFDLTALWLTDQPEAGDGEPQPAAAEAERPRSLATAPGPRRAESGLSESGRSESGRSESDSRPAGAGPATRPRDGGQRVAEVGASNRTPVVAGPGRPLSAPADLSRPAAGRPSPKYPPGRSVVSGRAAQATLPLVAPPPKQRLALVLTVMALLVAVGGAYAVINRPKERPEATAAPSPSSAQGATPLYTLIPPPVAASSAPPSRAAPPPSPKPTVTISYDDAVTRLKTTIQNGADSGQIRPDVATDLLNFVAPLTGADAKDIDGQIQALRRKISGRAGEGALSPAQAAAIRARVTDLERAAGM